MKRRAQQISSTLQRELQGRMSKGFNDPRIRGLITITKVEMTDDLKNAKAYISVLPPERAELTMHGIKAASGRIRKDVMDRMHLKEMPTLSFVYDHGMREEQIITELLASDPFRTDPLKDTGEDAQSTEPESINASDKSSSRETNSSESSEE